jgi:sulfite exporter TauE/SafE
MTAFSLPLEYPALFLAGLALGLGVCSTTCLPLMGACLLGNSRRPADGLYAAAAFTLGRLFTATVLGGICGVFGGVLKSALDGSSLIALSGLVTLAAGVYLMARPRKAACTSCQKAGAPPLLLGLASPLIPCLPYVAMMAAAASSGSLWKGASVAAVFTLGTSLSPLVILAAAMGWLGAGFAARIPNQIAILSRLGGVAVAFWGVSTLYNGLTIV